MGRCFGTSDDHCCYVLGKPCKYLEIGTEKDRKWVCGIRRKYGNWVDAEASEEYQRDIRPVFEPLGLSCATWPAKDQKCATCGQQGWDEADRDAEVAVLREQLEAGE